VARRLRDQREGQLVAADHEGEVEDEAGFRRLDLELEEDVAYAVAAGMDEVVLVDPAVVEADGARLQDDLGRTALTLVRELDPAVAARDAVVRVAGEPRVRARVERLAPQRDEQVAEFGVALHEAALVAARRRDEEVPVVDADRLAAERGHALHGDPLVRADVLALAPEDDRIEALGREDVEPRLADEQLVAVRRIAVEGRLHRAARDLQHDAREATQRAEQQHDQQQHPPRDERQETPPTLPARFHLTPLVARSSAGRRGATRTATCARP
jgi:hypothetical protein